METHTTFTFPLHITGDMVSEAVRAYADNITRGSQASFTYSNIDPNIMFLYRFSEPDCFDCSTCGGHIGVVLFGEADELSTWDDIVVLDAEADDLSIKCEDCYTDLMEELS